MFLVIAPDVDALERMFKKCPCRCPEFWPTLRRPTSAEFPRNVTSNFDNKMMLSHAHMLGLEATCIN
jgi:hypothetical protein